MRNYLIIVVICVTVVNGVAQPTSDKEERERENCLQALERKINAYADSLNFWVPKSDFPKFIFQPTFDQTHFFGNECINDRNTFSFRKAIFDRVTNTEVLKAIVKNESIVLDRVYFLPKELTIKDSLYFSNFAYSTHSNRYMAKKRLERIKQLKKAFKKR